LIAIERWSVACSCDEAEDTNMNKDTRKLSLVRDTLITMNDAELGQVNGGNGTDVWKMVVDVTTVAVPATVEIWKEIRKDKTKDTTDRDKTRRNNGE
jgi:hypothetical protein